MLGGPNNMINEMPCMKKSLKLKRFHGQNGTKIIKNKEKEKIVNLVF